MIVSLSGAHRTGKTTVLQQLQSIRPEWGYLSEPARTIAPVISFSNPLEFLEKHGISMLQAIQISLFAGLMPELNPAANDANEQGIDQPIIVDRSPLDYLAYFDLFKKEQDLKHQALLTDLASFFMSKIDLVVYFPVGVFELTDEPGDRQGKQLQAAVDSFLTNRLERYEGTAHVLNAIEPMARAEEIAELIAVRKKSRSSKFLSAPSFESD